MAIPWDSIRSLLLLVGPILVPKLLAFYRASKNSRNRALPIQSIPVNVSVALTLLASLTILYLAKTIPYFAPENVFSKTESRLQIPVDVLFTRIASSRPNETLTAADHVLRSKFINLESRLLYLQFGPDVLSECPFCNSDEPRSYFYYAIPAIIWPHIVNTVAIAAVTSPTLTGRHGAQWRTYATIASGILGAVEVYLVSSYNYQVNSRALRLHQLDMFFWDMRTYRYAALAVLNAGLAYVLFLSSTNRAFGTPPSPAERVETANRALGAARGKLNALGIIRNTTVRDDELRTRVQHYWAHEVRLMGEVMEEREVVEGVNDALSNRIKIEDISRDAETYAQSVLQPLETKKEE
ncbi:uncharacterized protein J7T54_001479 [Emericellopsis cladophorae]|uniref:Chorismate synthase protein n=1 Tax=Emericellopsis cladophorae TaxID=2686198 RepID=A0A9Q0BD51_9HYPO|nr:uncharacterized protein J7T54_001479 [Emericellopsis cladophorae]KAI6781517.1 hypothetical protein J7T54_001479 [Emericellopsis cladophorae]